MKICLRKNLEGFLAPLMVLDTKAEANISTSYFGTNTKKTILLFYYLNHFKDHRKSTGAIWLKILTSDSVAQSLIKIQGWIFESRLSSSQNPW